MAKTKTKLTAIIAAITGAVLFWKRKDSGTTHDSTHR